MAKEIIINSRKFDGSIKKTWTADLIEIKSRRLTLLGEFNDEIRHRELGLIRRGTISYEFFWFDRWFNIFRFHEPEGSFRNFYCNLCMPLQFQNNVIDYIDLDIDVCVSSKFEIKVLDMGEFQGNKIRFSYPKELQIQIYKSLQILLKLIENRRFPFDFRI